MRSKSIPTITYGTSVYGTDKFFYGSFTDAVLGHMTLNGTFYSGIRSMSVAFASGIGTSISVPNPGGYIFSKAQVWKITGDSLVVAVAYNSWPSTGPPRLIVYKIFHNQIAFTGGYSVIFEETFLSSDNFIELPRTPYQTPYGSYVSVQPFHLSPVAEGREVNFYFLDHNDNLSYVWGNFLNRLPEPVYLPLDTERIFVAYGVGGLQYSKIVDMFGNVLASKDYFSSLYSPIYDFPPYYAPAQIYMQYGLLLAIPIKGNRFFIYFPVAGSENFRKIIRINSDATVSVLKEEYPSYTFGSKFWPDDFPEAVIYRMLPSYESYISTERRLSDGSFLHANFQAPDNDSMFGYGYGINVNPIPEFPMIGGWKIGSI